MQSLRKDIRTLSREMGGISTTNRRASASYTTLNREAGKANKSLTQATRGALAGSGAFRGLGRAVAFSSAAFLGAAGLSNIIRGAIDELEAAGQAAAQTNTVIKDTGEIAGVTAKHVDDLAKSLLKKSGGDDEAIKSAENLLLAFTNIRNVAGEGNDVFDQATKSTLDLSIAMHRDLNSTALALGKALQDPIKGMTALRRVGVTFTAAQTATVKKLIESNRVLDAQKLILDEVRKRSEGAAKAYGNTLPGQIDKARESFRNLSAEAIKPLLPDIAKAAQAAADFFEKPSTEKQLREAVQTAADAFTQIAGAIGQAKDALGGWRNTIKLLIALKAASVISGWATQIGLFGDAIGPAGGDGALGRSTKLRESMKSLARIGVITIGLELIFDESAKKKVEGFLRKHGIDLDLDKGLIQIFDHKTSRAQTPFFGVNPAFGGAPLKPGSRLGTGGIGTTPGISGVFPGAGPAGSPFSALTKGHRKLLQGTHPTDGLPGFPALDIAAQPGDLVLAPENGVLTRISGHDPSAGSIGAAGVLGFSLYFVGDSGTTYFMTHLAGVAPQGRYKKGQRIGIVARHPRGTHLHIGVHQGRSSAAFAPSTQRPNLARPSGTQTGAAPPQAGNAPNAKPKTLAGLFKTPAGLSIRNALAAAAGTPKNRKDDIKALRGEETFLQQALASATKGSVLYTQILEKIGSVKQQIASKRKGATTGPSELLSRPIRTAIVKAEGTLGTVKDDIKAWQDAIKFLRTLQGKVKEGSEKWIEIHGQINDARARIAGLRGDKSGELVPLKLRTGLSKAEGTKSLQDDLKALRNIQTFLTGALKGTKGEKRLTILDELHNVKDRISGVVRDILDKAKSEVEKHRTSLGTAFGKVADSLLSSFDEKTSQLVDGINSSFDALTPAEQELLGIQGRVRGRERVDLAATVEKAQKRLDRATGRRRATAQRDLDEARDALREFDLTPIADAERAAAEKRRTAALDALDKQRTDERKALEGKIAAFQAMLEKGGLDMGTAFAKGILAGFPAFKKAVDQYGAYLEGKGLTGTPGSGTTTSKLPIDPAIATAIRNGRGGTRAFQAVSATTPVIIQGGTFIGTNLDTAAADIAEALAKYNRRNGRQPV